MPIEFRCNQCDVLLRTADDTAGRAAICPRCGANLTVPEPWRGAPEVFSGPVPTPAPASSERDNLAIASLILGFCALGFFCCCPLTLPCSLAGLILGFRGLDSERRGLAVSGIALSCLGLFLAILFAIFQFALHLRLP